MLYELKLRMFKAELYIPKRDHKLFSTPYMPQSQESRDQTNSCKECMSSNNETETQKDSNLTAWCTASDELQKHDEEKDKETEEGGKCEGNSQDDNDDSGYHTPTSPARTIAPVLKCPPPPKRPKCVRYIKRNSRIGITRRRLLVPDEQIVSFFRCEIETGWIHKKARREEK